MKKCLQFTISVLLCLLIGNIQSIMAIPAVPWPVEKQQPDGTMITVFIKGDEKVHWMESEDGYTLLYDDKKNVVYAQLNAEQNLVPSDILFHNTRSESTKNQLTQRGINPKLRYSKAQINTLLQIWEMDESMSLRSDSKVAVTGSQKAVCILVEFKDKSFIKTVEEFDNLMNQTGYNANGANGSVKDYYKEASYGKLDYSVTVVGPYKLSQNCEYYGESRYSVFARDAIIASDADVDFSEYGDENNQLNNIHLIFAGYGDEAINNGKQIWSHKSNLYPAVTLDGIRISTYSCSPELRGGYGTTITSIGVVCHELCHVFGAPDFYDANYETGGSYLGTGSWDLMANGSWNDNGVTPAHINMYQKIQFGWVDPVVLSNPQEVTGMKNSAENPVAYVIESTNVRDYYILENRQKIGYDSYVPGSGLLIYHISVNPTNPNSNNVNNTHPQRVYPVCASTTYQYPTSASASYGPINTDGCTFNNMRDAFTAETIPAAFIWDTSGSSVSHTPLNRPITNISEKDQLISFKYMMVGDPVISLSSTYDEQKQYLTLKWDVSGISKAKKGFNIYRNGTFLTNTTKQELTQVLRQDGTYVYAIAILYMDETESAKEEITVIIENGQLVTSIKDINAGQCKVYPNPVSSGDLLTIDLGNDHRGSTSFTIYDISGRKLLNQAADSQLTKLPVDLPKGIYLLEISKATGSEIVKFSVK